jgi:hypothetical protein
VLRECRVGASFGAESTCLRRHHHRRLHRAHDQRAASSEQRLARSSKQLQAGSLAMVRWVARAWPDTDSMHLAPPDPLIIPHRHRHPTVRSARLPRPQAPSFPMHLRPANPGTAPE